MSKKKSNDPYESFCWEEYHEQALKDHIRSLEKELNSVKKENALLRQKVNKKQNKQVEK